MFKNHFKITIRTTIRHKVYSAINIFGLAAGIASFIIIMLYIHDESSYDQFHSDADRIHRVVHDDVFRAFGGQSRAILTPGALKEAILNEVPEVEQATHFHSVWEKTPLSNEKYTYYDNKFLHIDASFFDIFSFQFIHGDAKSTFENLSSIILTKRLANKFFGHTDVIGELLTFDQKTVLKITGVLEDIPSQSHLQFDFLVPGIRPKFMNNWEQGHMHTYIKIRPQASLPEIGTKIQRLVDTYHQSYMERKNIQETYYTQPLTGKSGIHLSPRSRELTAGGNKRYINLLLMAGFFILIIAGINYINLTTARSAIRAREIGVRKVVGAFRKTLIYQFLTESTFIAFMAGIVAIGLTEAVLPFFNHIIQKELSLFATGVQPVWGFMAMAVFVIGIAAGIYPAFYLSAFKPISIFRKLPASKKTGFNLRRFLVISQFSLSAFLTIGMIMVQKQLTFVQSANLGFDKEQVIIIRNFYSAPKHDQGFVVRNALKALPGVIEVGGALESRIGMRHSPHGGGLKVSGSDGAPIAYMSYLADEGFLDVFGFKLIEGRNFSLEFASDLRNGCILNETAVKQLGIEGSALGQKVSLHTKDEYTVIGVVEDYHAASLHTKIAPFIFSYFPKAFEAAIKLSPGEIPETLTRIEETWAQLVPGVPMDYYFLDNAIDQLYRSELNFQRLFSFMTALVLIIACLGLFGLSAFMADQRTKEVAIRKVMGAPVRTLLSLLSKEFVILVGIANLIAWPLAYYTINKWLENFAYKVAIEWNVFLMAALLVLLLAILTVSAITYRTATTNPVNSLRDE